MAEEAAGAAVWATATGESSRAKRAGAKGRIEPPETKLQDGVTYAGQTLDTSTNGTFQGILDIQTVMPGGANGNVYTFAIPTGSAALLTVN